MALTTKRIIALPSQTDPQEGDYLAIDNATGGTHKIPVGRIGVEVDDTLTEQGKAADAKATGDALDEIRSQIEVTGTASGAIATFTDGAEMPAKSVIVNIEPKQSGTGTPSPDNVRTISGWSSVKNSVTGKNLFDKDEVSDGKWLSTTTGLEENSNNYCVSDFIPVQKNKPIYIPATQTARRWFYDINKTPKTYMGESGNQAYYPTEDGFIRMSILVRGTNAINLDTYQVEYGTSATSYEPFGTTTTTPLGRTVYGGTLDVVTGVLTVDRAMVDLGTLRWSKKTDGVFYSWDLQNLVKATTSAFIIANGVCSALQMGSYDAVYNNATLDNGISVGTESQLGAHCSNYTDAADFKTAMSGVQLVYELAQPQTYTLTGQEISTLLGENNVWADSGDVEVVYVRDLNLAINNLLNSNGTRSLGMMAMSAPTEATAEEPTDEQSDEDMR